MKNNGEGKILKLWPHVHNQFIYGDRSLQPLEAGRGFSNAPTGFDSAARVNRSRLASIRLFGTPDLNYTPSANHGDSVFALFVHMTSLTARRSKPPLPAIPRP